jgi:superfamily II DNA or RNA helicase
MTIYFHSYEPDEPHDAVILILAPVGSANTVRGMVGRAIRKALGVKKWHEGKHDVSYLPAGYEYPEFDARFILTLTNTEMKTLAATLKEMREDEGWDGAPYEIYHD